MFKDWLGQVSNDQELLEFYYCVQEFSTDLEEAHVSKDYSEVKNFSCNRFYSSLYDFPFTDKHHVYFNEPYIAGSTDNLPVRLYFETPCCEDFSIPIVFW